MNKTFSTLAITACLTIVTGVHAAPRWQHDRPQKFSDTARVIRVVPLYQQVQISTPRRECWQEKVRYPVTRSYGPSRASSTLVGAIIGGVIGNQFGGGDGKRLATAAGTMLGASIGNDAARARERYTTYDRVSYETRCSTEVDYHTESQIEAYRVTYRYRGQLFTTRLAYDPGKTLRLRIRVAPEE